MQRVLFTSLVLFFCLTGLATAQVSRLLKIGEDTGLPPASLSSGGDSKSNFSGAVPADLPPIPLTAPVTLPRMGPELALQAYRGRVILQATQLASYSATTIVRAELPDTQQYGEYELQRRYSAPRSLMFTALHFTGDGFVKNNVILRLLQSEVDHVQKDDPSLNAITPANYKFSYKGTGQLQGRAVHIYQLKPRQKRPGLFKGRIYLDAYTGSMVRAEGRLAKSPSLFIKKVEFVQDYVDIGPFTFPCHLHSEAHARLVGRAIVDIYEHGYQPVSNLTQALESPPTL